MVFLRFLEAHRLPVLDSFFSAITYLGAETAFMALALLMFWCVSKRQGYYVFFTGFFGTTLSQALKLMSRLPRPWVADPRFTIAESARADATGYSFPSGHTQNAVGTFGAIAVGNKRAWVRIVCAALIVLIPFSRLYLGVHTPLDVSVAFAAAVLLVLVLMPAFRDERSFERSMPWLLAAVAVCTLGYLAYVLLYPFPADTDAENLAHGIQNAYTMTGCILGFFPVYYLDRRYIRFRTEAPFLGQVLKYVLGLALLVAVKSGLKPVLNALFSGHPASYLVRYLLIVLFAGLVWPLTFPFFSRIGAKRRSA